MFLLFTEYTQKRTHDTRLFKGTSRVNMTNAQNLHINLEGIQPLNYPTYYKCANQCPRDHTQINCLGPVHDFFPPVFILSVPKTKSNVRQVIRIILSDIHISKIQQKEERKDGLQRREVSQLFLWGLDFALLSFLNLTIQLFSPFPYLQYNKLFKKLKMKDEWQVFLTNVQIY